MRKFRLIVGNAFKLSLIFFVFSFIVWFMTDTPEILPAVIFFAAVAVVSAIIYIGLWTTYTGYDEDIAKQNDDYIKSYVRKCKEKQEQLAEERRRQEEAEQNETI